MQPANYDLNRQKYRWFADNRRRTESEIMRDYDRLIADPTLMELDFMAQDPNILMLRTPIIDIAHDGVYRRIGAFAILINRRHNERAWKISYRFVNLHGTISRGENGGTFHHPHIIQETSEYLQMPVGRFCISKGAEILDKPLREGRIPEAYPMFLELLTLYPTDKEFMEVEQWPIVDKIDTRKQR